MPLPGPADAFAPHAPSAESAALAADRRRVLLRAADRLPGRCPRLVRALLEPPSAPYQVLADELGLPRGSIGPLRSRCLGCLRRRLAADGWSREDLA